MFFAFFNPAGKCWTYHQKRENWVVCVCVVREKTCRSSLIKTHIYTHLTGGKKKNKTTPFRFFENRCV
jgi:hypothetical protein